MQALSVEDSGPARLLIRDIDADNFSTFSEYPCLLSTQGGRLPFDNSLRALKSFPRIDWIV